MSYRVVGYRDGKRIVVEEGPARARIAGYGHGNTHDLTLIGSFVSGDHGPAEKHRQEVAAHKRSKR